MEITPEKEKIFYHSVLQQLKNNYRELENLKNNLGTWKNVWEEFCRRKDLRTSGGVGIDPETEWQKLDKTGIRLILQNDEGFPSLLREIPWPPFGIYVLGELPAAQPTIAIVGTRKATEEGLGLANRFGFELGRAGLIVVSGLAFGIDAASHRGCLEARGKTMAVLANGLDNIYPASNEKLAEKILSANGCLVSEYPPGTPALPHQFLERNRLISGLSLGVVVIEAPKNSGSLVTARFAIDQNREVFVVPGPVNHKNFFGSHQLLRSGARLITRSSEILEDLNLTTETEVEINFETIEEKVIFEILKNNSNGLGVDKIIEITNLEPQVANRGLTLLLIKNLIKEDEYGYKINL